jgi:hypothetical protein
LPNTDISFTALPGHRDINSYYGYIESLYNTTLHNITQPDVNLSTSPIDQVLVLDSGGIESLIYSAVSLALNKTPYQDDSSQTCISSAYLPARGAALRAADWIWYYRAEHDTELVEWWNGDEIGKERMAWEKRTKKMADESGLESEQVREIWEDMEGEWDEWLKKAAEKL